MRAKPIYYAMAICLGSLTPTLCARANSSKDRKEIEALFVKLDKAMEAKDLNGVISTGAKGFSYTEQGRTMQGSQISDLMKHQLSMIIGSPKAKTTVISCEVKGKEATVITTDHTEMTVPGKDKKPHHLVSESQAKDLVIKTDKGWLMKTVVVTSSKMTIDGKPFNPVAAPPKK